MQTTEQNDYFYEELKAIGVNIRTYRLNAGKDEAAVAEALGISTDQLKKIEDGDDDTIRVSLIEDAARYFNISPSDFFAKIPREKFEGSGIPLLPGTDTNRSQPEE